MSQIVFSLSVPTFRPLFLSPAPTFRRCLRSPNSLFCACPGLAHQTRQQVPVNHFSTALSSGYGIPDYTTPKVPSPESQPDEDYVSGESVNKPFWEYGAPKPYQSPGSYTSPKVFTSPAAYGLSTIAGGGGGESNGGGSGGNDGGDSGEEENTEDDGEPKETVRKLKTSQLLTVIYAGVVFLGGLAGYLKSGSTKSLTAGTVSAMMLLLVVKLLSTHPVPGSIVGLGVSGALLAVMGKRFLNSGRFFPAGFVALLSFIMGGGYIHGIARSSHA